MSGIEINKIAGAILTAALISMVIGIVGDALVHPKKHTAASVQVAAAHVPAAKKEKPLPPIAPLLAKANVAEGKKVSNKCHACHDLSKARKTKIGPPLWDIVGAKRGQHTPSFSYSSAMKKVGGSWTYKELNHFLHNPRGYIHGTKMTFAGVKNDQERADLIAYLRTLSDSPKPLPQPAK